MGKKSSKTRTVTNKFTPAKLTDAMRYAIGDPMGTPPGCVRLMVNTLYLLRVEASYMEDFATRHRDMLCQVVAFVMARRPLGLPEFVQAAQTCRCHDGDLPSKLSPEMLDRLHSTRPAEWPPSRPDPTIPDMIYIVCEMLETVIQDRVNRGASIYKVARNKSRADKAGKQLAFPAEPSDVVPFEPSVCVGSLIAWMDLLPGMFAPIRIGSAMLTSTGALTIPAWAKSGVLKHLTRNVLVRCQRVQDLLEDWQLAPSRVAREAVEPNLLGDLACFEVTASFLDALGSRMQDREIAMFARELADAEVQMAFQDVLDTLEMLGRRGITLPERKGFMGMEEIFGTFLQLGARIHELKGSEGRGAANRDTHPQIVKASQQIRELKKDPWFASAIAYSTFGHMNRCFAPGCLQSHSSLCTKFARCKGCERVPYCSRECQKRAWRHEKVPHAPVCKLIKEFGEIGKLSNDPQKNDIKKAQELVKSKVQRSDAQAIYDYVDGLHAAYSATVEDLGSLDEMAAKMASLTVVSKAAEEGDEGDVPDELIEEVD